MNHVDEIVMDYNRDHGTKLTSQSYLALLREGIWEDETLVGGVKEPTDVSIADFFDEFGFDLVAYLKACGVDTVWAGE